MRAEFRSDDLHDLPELTVVAESETEWRALQLYLKLMAYGTVKFHAAYSTAPEVPRG